MAEEAVGCGALDLWTRGMRGCSCPPAANHRVRTQARPNGRLRLLECNSIKQGIASTNGAELSKKINYRKINR